MSCKNDIIPSSDKSSGLSAMLEIVIYIVEVCDKVLLFL